MTRRGLVGIGVAVVAVAAAGFVAVRVAGSTESVVTAANPLIPTTHVVAGPLELSVNAIGDLRAANTAMLITPSVPGTLRILTMVPTGTAVKKDEIIVELDPTEQTYALEQSKSELAQAEQEIAKKKADSDVQAAQDKVDLLTARFDVRRAELDAQMDKDLIAANQYAKRQLALEEAKRKLAQIEGDVKARAEASKAGMTLLTEKKAKAELTASRAEQSIESLKLKAPIDGHVIIRENRDASGGMFFSGMTLPEYRVGDNTFAGRPIADVYDLSGMEIRVKVGEADRGNVTSGQAATVKSDALPGVPLQATVKTIAGMAMQNWEGSGGPMRQFDASLSLKNADGRLRPGTSVSVIIEGKKIDRVLQLPLQAVRQREGKPVVFVQKDGKFTATPVKVLYRTESRVGLEGIAEGTVVALVDPENAAKAAEKPASPAPGPGAVK
jgi:HlyD family secretion protein